MGWLSLEHIVKYSSNIGAVKISETIGPDALYAALKNFGFGTRTGIDCPGETSGILTSPRVWSKIDTGAIAFGQGISVSAIQLVTAVSAIANDGILMRPFIVQGITDHNGRLVQGFSPSRVRRAVSVETARTVKSMMQTVTEEGGTGVNAAVKGYSVAGKTGTAQKSEKGGYAKGKYTASFVGFTPVENPAIAILVIVDEPLGSHYASVVAAPVFRDIAHGTLTYLNIAPLREMQRLTASGKKGVHG
jgi:cell division protein FtsI (penicillin-binding protein 3)